MYIKESVIYFVFLVIYANYAMYSVIPAMLSFYGIFFSSIYLIICTKNCELENHFNLQKQVDSINISIILRNDLHLKFRGD